MPELGLKNSRFIHELRIQRRNGDLSKGSAKKTARRHGLQLIGAGDESIVVRHPRRQDRVVAIHHVVKVSEQDNLSAKLTFYYHNILADLFPNNFPRIHASFGNNNDWTAMTGTVREFVEKRRIKDIFRRKTHPFSRVKQEWEQYGMELDIDTGRRSNFIVTKDGKQHYVDMVRVFPYQVPQIEKTVARVLKNREYSEEIAERVTRHVEELKNLVTGRINTR